MLLKSRTFFQFLSFLNIGILLTLFFYTGPATAQTESRSLTYSAVAVLDHEATIAAHIGIVSALSQALKAQLRIVVDRDHQTLVNDFISGEVDIAYLGPLPYVVILQEYPDLVVLAAINEESGLAEYRCALISAYDGPVSVSDVSGRIALTSPMSTCGYLSMAHMLASHGIDIEKQDYRFIGSHDQVALGVIGGQYVAGCVKDMIAQKYQGLLLQVLDTTPSLPGFVLVANRNSFSSTEIKQMRSALLQAKPDNYKAWGVGNYGFTSADQLDYALIDVLMTPEFRKLFMGGLHDH